MTATFSTVHHTTTVDELFTKVPNALIRDPDIRHSEFRVICWFASQAEGRVVYLKVMREELGMTWNTALRALDGALATDYLSRTETGGKDHQGNVTFTYVVCLNPTSKTEAGRLTKSESKKTTEKTISSKALPPRAAEATTSTQSKLTELPADWQPNATNRRKLAQAKHWGEHLDAAEVVEFFKAMHCCEEPECPKKPRRANWQKSFSAFIDAWVLDEHEDKYDNHYTLHHDPEFQEFLDQVGAKSRSHRCSSSPAVTADTRPLSAAQHRAPRIAAGAQTIAANSPISNAKPKHAPAQQKQ